MKKESLTYKQSIFLVTRLNNFLNLNQKTLILSSTPISRLRSKSSEIKAIPEWRPADDEGRKDTEDDLENATLAKAKGLQLAVQLAA